uniref:Uncharacterized protein n=1 Tax=Arundo donax TaxID=35708 RepID=A0A0A9BJD2_ARUDO
MKHPNLRVSKQHELFSPCTFYLTKRVSESEVYNHLIVQ